MLQTRDSTTGEDQGATTMVFPDIPDDLILPDDRLITANDWERLHSDIQGDSMYGYAYGSLARLDFLAGERAAIRLSLAGVEQLDPCLVADLKSQQAIGAVSLSGAFE